MEVLIIMNKKEYTLINKEEILEKIKNSITDKNVGSYVIDRSFDPEGGGWGEDYFADAENVDEVLENAEQLIEETNTLLIEKQKSNEDLNKIELIEEVEKLNEKLKEIKVEWDTDINLDNFSSFKDDEETLDDQNFDLLVSYSKTKEELIEKLLVKKELENDIKIEKIEEPMFMKENKLKKLELIENGAWKKEESQIKEKTLEKKPKMRKQLFIGSEISKEDILFNYETNPVNNKPSKAFWTSSYDEQLGSDWVQWCISENFDRTNIRNLKGVEPEMDEWGYEMRSYGDKREITGSLVKPHSDAKVYVINSENDLNRLLDDYGKNSGYYGKMVDYEKLSKEYDALHLTHEGREECCYSGSPMHFWDVESTVWLKPKFELEYIGEKVIEIGERRNINYEVEYETITTVKNAEKKTEKEIEL